MATIRQACNILDDVFRLPPSSARGHAQRLRLAGLIPATQGHPAQISNEDIAAILIGTVVGSSLVSDYLAMKPLPDGPTFGAVIADFVGKPHAAEVTIDTLSPAATVTFRNESGALTMAFQGARSARPAFTREVKIGPDIFLRLAAAIAAAPVVKAGRPPLRERFNRRA